MAKRILQGIGAVFVTVWLAGCQPASTANPPSQSSVVVDLDAVAKALNWDTLIANRVEEATRQLNSQLVAAANGMEAELKQQQTALGANPSPEAVEQFKQAQLRVQQNIQNNKRIAEQAREAVRSEQIALFRKRVKPIAGRLAEARDAKVVLIANQDVVWFSPAVDITGDVIAAMRAENQQLEEGRMSPKTNQETESATATNQTRDSSAAGDNPGSSAGAGDSP